MLRKFISQYIGPCPDELLAVLTADIKFNRIRFGKRTTLSDIINLARSDGKMLRSC
jgi:hypothetical protein